MDPNTIEQMDDRLLLINLYITQGITLGLGLLGFFTLQTPGNTSYFFLPVNFWRIIILAFITAAVIITADVILSLSLPKHYMDDGGINKKLFLNRPVGHIFLMVVLIAFSEELLFRVVIQSHIGIWLTSILFSFIHIRYLKKWVMFTSVFIVSLIIGWLFSTTGSAIAPILCHFLIDFVLALLIRFNLLNS